MPIKFKTKTKPPRLPLSRTDVADQHDGVITRSFEFPDEEESVRLRQETDRMTQTKIAEMLWKHIKD